MLLEKQAFEHELQGGHLRLVSVTLRSRATNWERNTRDGLNQRHLERCLLPASILEKHGLEERVEEATQSLCVPSSFNSLGLSTKLC